jgi:hypothetical protein
MCTRTAQIALACFLVVFWARWCDAQQAPTDAQTKALQSLPWYDAQRQQLRSPVMRPLVDPPAPQDWDFQLPDFSLPRWSGAGFGSIAARTLEIAAYVMLITGGIWLVIFIARSYRDFGGRAGSNDAEDVPTDAIDVEKLAELPFRPPTTQADLLSTIRQKYEQRKFSEAIILLFGYQLLQLDKHQIIRLLRGKTNRQYLREVGTASRLGNMLSETMVTFEDHFFGAQAISQARFEACWNQLDEFHRQLNLTPTAATTA